MDVNDIINKLSKDDGVVGDVARLVKDSNVLVDTINKLAKDIDSIDPTTPSKPKPKPKEEKEEKDTQETTFPSGDTVVTGLSYLHPKVESAASNALQECMSNGCSLTIVETYRTPERQTILFNQGRSEAGTIVTKAQSYESYHNYGLALDVSPATNAVVQIFESYGFEWGGRWKSFKDTPHFQMSFGLSISDLKNLYSEGGMQAVWDHIGYD